jgi:hypothetical protein
MAQNLKRGKSLNFRVNEQEYEWIKRRQKQAGIMNTRAYLLKMAVDGRVVHVEMDSIKERNTLLRSISNNVNQIAARVNATGSVYAVDIADIRAKQAEIWEQQKAIMEKLTKLAERA